MPNFFGEGRSRVVPSCHVSASFSHIHTHYFYALPSLSFTHFTQGHRAAKHMHVHTLFEHQGVIDKSGRERLLSLVEHGFIFFYRKLTEKSQVCKTAYFFDCSAATADSVSTEYPVGRTDMALKFG